MERILLSEIGVPEAAARAVAVLKRGGVVLYPTDTLYGLGADALSDEAVAKIYDIKGRKEDRPMHALVSGLEMAERFSHVDQNARVLAQNLPKGKISLILKKKEVDTGIAKDIPTFGIRIPDSEFCIQMIESFGGPITATSANAAGKKPQCSVAAILEQLGDAGHRIDLIVDGGELPASEPSSVIDLSMDLTLDEGPVILREGAVPTEEIWGVLRSEY